MNVNSNTDVMDFLEIIGWTYGWGPHYRKANEKLKQKIRDRFHERRKSLPRDTKGLESLFSNSLMGGYRRDFKSVEELRQIIEEKGLIYNQMGCKGIAYLNTTLQKYGISPIRIGGNWPCDKTLKRYGLEKDL